MNREQSVDARGVGRWMMIISWVLLLALLSYLFNGVLEHQNNPNSSPETSTNASGTAEVILVRNRAGHYVANGRINGHEVLFLLDTGATDVALSLELAEKLELPRGAQMISQTANGAVISWQTRLSEVSLGDIALSNVSASVLPSISGNEVLLGMSFLKRLELIQRGDQLTLRKL
ncbi:MAG: TIGR02281 family clan AA aspartic protease [Sedimenticola sp.]|nr:TIGR02281 family clan AA aspartic protease [Sedimenticola sp.]MCW8883249.1 TIGR02281 family clan AA aspartic protease [Sedimenticola sp.]MCW8921732.1 TIGR02281 family clan AA aspartic protease [Sedimenticola sp.]MCW8947707.1 TIGR02281 family clan AA aspartic protease [Sedimenticola sp.]MCW8951037.1 TIGR02281 family clan AA aspartic protease [Sedimenticola sp.]